MLSAVAAKLNAAKMAVMQHIFPVILSTAIVTGTIAGGAYFAGSTGALISGTVVSDDEFISGGDGGSLTGNAQIIYEILHEKGLGDVQIAALLGNFQNESGLNPQSCQYGTWQGTDGRTYTFTYGNNSRPNYPKALINHKTFGYGLAGFTWPEMCQRLVDFAKKKHKPSGDCATQIEWFYQDEKFGLMGWRDMARFEKMTSVTEAAALFMLSWERPASKDPSKRQRDAKDFLSQIKSGGMVSGNIAGARAKLVKAAYSQLGVPYVWGGTTPKGQPHAGLDCSGLTQYCYKQIGISIPRTSGQQLAGGEIVQLPLPGDICWTPGHVALYIGNGQMIEAQQTGVPVKVSAVRVTHYVRYLKGSQNNNFKMPKNFKYKGRVTAKMKNIVRIAYNNRGTRPCTANYCAAWVSGVIQAAGYGYPGGNAIDYWKRYKHTGSRQMDNIPPGAVVVGSGVGSMGAQYGHVGIYLGNGMVANNVGHFSVEPLPKWISWQSATCAGYRGWIGWVMPVGKR